jgi:hypothetical protein
MTSWLGIRICVRKTVHQNMLEVNYFRVPKGIFYFIWYYMAWKQYFLSYSFVWKYSWKQYYFKIVVITYSFVNSVIFLFQSEAADTVSGMTDALPPRTRERLKDAIFLVLKHLFLLVTTVIRVYRKIRIICYLHL